MMSIQEIADKLEKSFELLDDKYPFEIEESPADEETLYVRLFGVPNNKVEDLEDLVFDIQDELGDATDYLLLPMVKDLETTRQHYRQYLVESAGIPTDINRLFNTDKSGWKELEIQVPVDEEESLDIANIEYFINASDKNKEMQQVDDTSNASNDDDLSKAA